MQGEGSQPRFLDSYHNEEKQDENKKLNLRVLPSKIRPNSAGVHTCLLFFQNSLWEHLCFLTALKFQSKSSLLVYYVCQVVKRSPLNSGTLCLKGIKIHVDW